SAGPTWLEPIRPQSLYDIRLYDAYCSALEGLVPGLKPEHWREMGQAALEAEIVADARHVLAAADLASLLTGAIEVWSSLFDGGSWHYELRGTRAVEVVLSNFHQVSVRLRSWLVGLVEQTFRAAGFASARADFAPAAGPANPLTLRITFECPLRSVLRRHAAPTGPAASGRPDRLPADDGCSHGLVRVGALT